MAKAKIGGKRISYNFSDKAIEFIDAFNEETTLAKHKIVSDSVEFSSSNKEAFFNFVNRKTLKSIKNDSQIDLN
jgi:hypothetical protein